MSKNIAEMPMLGLLEQLWLGDTALDDEALSWHTYLPWKGQCADSNGSHSLTNIGIVENLN